MGRSKGSKKNSHTIKINGAITIYEVTDLHRTLLQSLAENNTITIDLNDVESCDTAGIQLLFAAIKTGEKKGKQITVSGVSEAFQETARLVGIQQEIFSSSNGG